MNITFLGTGPAINIPRKGCRCLTCKDARKSKSKSRRTNSSVLITHKETNILINCTPDFKKQITTKLPTCLKTTTRQAKIRNDENDTLYHSEELQPVEATKNLMGAKRPTIDAVFLTHAHKDAVGGIKDLIKWLQKNKTQTTLYIHRETLKRLGVKISNFQFPITNKNPKSKIKNQKPNIQIKIIKPYQIIKLPNFKIVSFPVYHGLKKYPTFGYLIKSPSVSPLNKGELRRISTIIYASDIAGAPKQSLKYFKKAKILILDASMWFGKKIKGHFSAGQAIKFAEKMRAKKLYLTHIGHTFPPHSEAQKQINQYLKKEKVLLKVILTYDGMEMIN